MTDKMWATAWTLHVQGHKHKARLKLRLQMLMDIAELNPMGASQIVEAILERRYAAWEHQVLGTESDPLIYSEAELARAIADEYDRLLKEIGVITPQHAKSA